MQEPKDIDISEWYSALDKALISGEGMRISEIMKATGHGKAWLLRKITEDVAKGLFKVNAREIIRIDGRRQSVPVYQYIGDKNVTK